MNKETFPLGVGHFVPKEMICGPIVLAFIVHNVLGYTAHNVLGYTAQTYLGLGREV